MRDKKEKMTEINKVNIKYLPDSSILIDGDILDFIEDKYSILNENPETIIEIILSKVVLAEIENKANQDKITGVVGLEFLDKFRIKIEELNQRFNNRIKISIYGERPSLDQIKLNARGELDAIIRQHAKETGSILLTCDKIQANMAKIEQIEVIQWKPKEKIDIKRYNIRNFFDDTSMSIHLKTGCEPMAKKGKPGHWKLVKISDEKLSLQDIKNIESSIISEAKKDADSFIEKDLQGVTVVQLQDYRIVICRPPFSDANEITAVKPLVKLPLEYYNNLDYLLKRLEKAEGILVAGAPGAGKSTFISALTDFYLKKKKIIKTLESIRDLQVPPEVTQYSELEGDFEKSADILLLVRPDFTIFDEVRTTQDFKIFADMRLAGVGMVGVVHANSALDAIQRFIRRVELGVIPSIIDTVIFIKEGQISEILKLEITVKVPYGITDVGLARPVVEISDYITNKLLYEMYEFGSNIVVMPVGKHKTKTSKSKKINSKKEETDENGFKFQNLNEIRDYLDNPFEDDNYSEISELNSNSLNEPISNHIELKIKYGQKSLILISSPYFAGSAVKIIADDKLIAFAQFNKKGEIRVSKSSSLYHKIDSAIQNNLKLFGVIEKSKNNKF